MFESRRRYPEANWFELVGALGDEDEALVRILENNPYTAPKNADLYLFANDLDWKYGNNKGFLSPPRARPDELRRYQHR